MSDEATCGHTKIKEVRWNAQGGQSGKFMCLDCNTDFVPLTPAIRRFLFQQEFEREAAQKPLHVPPGLTTSTTGYVPPAHPGVIRDAPGGQGSRVGDTDYG